MSIIEGIKATYRTLRFTDPLGGVMVSVLASSAEGRGFDPQPGQTKDIKIGVCCFSSKHTAFRSKSIDWSAQSQNNLSG